MVNLMDTRGNDVITERLKKIKEVLITQGCDCFLSTCPVENRYLSGFTGSTSAILITQEKNLFITDFRYEEQVNSEVLLYEIIITKATVEKEIGNLLTSLNLKKILINPHRITYHLANELTNIYGVHLHSNIDCTANLRIVKNTFEVSLIQKACQITEDALRDTIPLIKEGITEKEVSAEIEYKMKQHGADSIAFDTIVLFGKRSSLPHGKPSNISLKAGDIVLIDCGCIYAGYCSDLTRTFVYGTIPGISFLEVYQTVLEAQTTALEKVKDGIPAKAVDAQARNLITIRGYGDYFGHGLGHGLGLEIHEPPRLNKDSEIVLREGMVVTIEPGIYIPGKGGVRIEDTILVTKNGYERLTTSSKELQVIPF